MIQRLQSALLFYAATMNIAVIFSPIWVVSNKVTDVGHFIYGHYTNLHEFHGGEKGQKPWKDTTIPFTDNIWSILLFVTLIVVSALIIYTIFKFKNRPLQIRLCYAAIAMVFMQIILTIVLTKHSESVLLTPGLREGDAESSYMPGFFLPIGVVLLCLWAAMRIKKDESLVKESSRLR